MSKLRQVFRVIDQDGNGSIDYAEFVDKWDLVVEEIENTVDVLDSEEVLDELGQVLGLSLLRKVPQGPLPVREKSIVRSSFAFISWLVIFLIIIFTRRDLAGSYRMSFGMRQQSTLEPFGGPRFDDNGVMQVDTGQTGYTVTPLQPYYMCAPRRAAAWPRRPANPPSCNNQVLAAQVRKRAGRGGPVAVGEWAHAQHAVQAALRCQRGRRQLYDGNQWLQQPRGRPFSHHARGRRGTGLSANSGQRGGEAQRGL